MIQKLKRFVFSYANTPIILALLVLASYAITIRFLGFFMDDWYLIWYKHIFGALQFPAYFSVDRPLMGYFYILANFLLANSESPLVWQIFGLFTRWLTVFALWGFLNTLWPNAKKQNTLVAILAAVFPGFTQQWIAVIYSFFFTCLAGFFFSLTLMLKAVRNPKRFWIYTVLSLIIGVYSYAAAEFYFGLELIRPVVLWIEYSRDNQDVRQKIQKTLKTWVPYFIAFLAFAIWRGFFYVSAHHEVKITQEILQSPLGFVIKSLQIIYQACIDAVFNSWVNPLNLSNYPTKGKVPFLILGIVILVFSGLVIWLRSITKNNFQETEAQNRSWNKEAFSLGLISLVVAVLPFLAADLPIGIDYPYDRFLLAYMFGSCLFLVTLLDKRKIGLYFIAFLLAISTGYQISKSVYYKNEYQEQSDFFWQLSWRAPQIQKNTVLLSEDLSFSDLFSSTSLTAPLNMIYASNLDSHNIPYFLLLYSQLQDVVPEFEPNLPINYDLRSFVFQGNTSSIMVFKKTSDSCLRLLSNDDSPAEFLHSPRYNFWEEVIPLSNLNQVITQPENAVTLPEKYFGVENTNQWCFYFEKADLARQLKKWDLVITLYDQASSKGFEPTNVSEWLPLIDAYANTNQLFKASDLTLSLKINDDNNKGIVCNAWEKIKGQITDTQMQGQAQNVLFQLQCEAIK